MHKLKIKNIITGNSLKNVLLFIYNNHLYEIIKQIKNNYFINDYFLLFNKMTYFSFIKEEF